MCTDGASTARHEEGLSGLGPIPIIELSPRERVGERGSHCFQLGPPQAPVDSLNPVILINQMGHTAKPKGKELPRRCACMCVCEEITRMHYIPVENCQLTVRNQTKPLFALGFGSGSWAKS